LRCCFGLAKKALVANQVALVADAVFAHPLATLPIGYAWLGLLAYGVQIYFDFSGYSYMAIGLGKMIGFSFKENFESPMRHRASPSPGVAGTSRSRPGCATTSTSRSAAAGPRRRAAPATSSSSSSVRPVARRELDLRRPGRVPRRAARHRAAAGAPAPPGGAAPPARDRAHLRARDPR